MGQKLALTPALSARGEGESLAAPRRIWAHLSTVYGEFSPDFRGLLGLGEGLTVGLMKAASELDHLEALKQSIEEELKRLKALAGEVEAALSAARSADIIAKTRSIQADASWLRELRDQYTKEVCERTLEANGQFPVAET